MTAVDTCVKNMEHLSLPQDPAPSSPLLQGERGSSRSSSELSSSEGVWQPRKGEKMRENGRKEKQQVKILPITFTNGEDVFNSACLGLLYPNPFTKYQKTKTKSYYKGQIWKKTKKGTKLVKTSKSRMVNSAGDMNNGCRMKISQDEQCSLRKFRSLPNFLQLQFLGILCFSFLLISDLQC